LEWEKVLRAGQEGDGEPLPGALERFRLGDETVEMEAMELDRRMMDARGVDVCRID
jgi:hypothetical protein